MDSDVSSLLSHNIRAGKKNRNTEILEMSNGIVAVWRFEFPFKMWISRTGEGNENENEK